MSKKKKKRPAPRRVAKYIKMRTGLVFLVVLGLMCFLLFQIIRINRYDGENYNKKILTQMAYDSQTIQAERGQILDRNGTSLAYNENQYNLILEPKNIIADEDNMEATITALVECYGYDREELETLITNNKKSYYQIYKKKLSEEEMQKFLDYKEAYENEETSGESETEEETSVTSEETEDKKGAADSGESSTGETKASEASETAGESQAAESSEQEESANPLVTAFQAVKEFFSLTGSDDEDTEKNGKIVGVYFETSQKRIYPYGSLASTTIGFSNSNGGVAGLEAQYDDLLSGINGRKYGYLNEESSVEIQTIQETDGYSLVTTIDAYIQGICEDIINKYEEEVGSNVTALMVMNPNNGEIYAMASSRQFDPNDPSDLTDIYSEEEIEAMTEEEKSEALLMRWRNFCTTSSYEPGSTAKIFTIAAGLEEDLLDTSSRYVCDGSGVYGNCRIHCHKRSGHGSLDITGALMASCNDALMQMGAEIGVEAFCEYQEKFNFGQLTGVDLPDELSCSNQIYHAYNMTSVDLATNSFGQNFYVTMVQMCAAYSSIVNGGNYYKPHVVKQVVDNEGNVVQNVEPILVRQTVSKSTSEYLKEALLQVVENGTGSRVQIEGYEIGGKTGTAEKNNQGDADEAYTVSFMSVVPAYDPEVVVYAIVDEPNCEKAQNTYQAKDVCKAALEQILPYLNIYPVSDEEVSDEHGDFTSPEDEEIIEDDASIIENLEEEQEAERIRQAADQARSGNTNTEE